MSSNTENKGFKQEISEVETKDSIEKSKDIKREEKLKESYMKSIKKYKIFAFTFYYIVIGFIFLYLYVLYLVQVSVLEINYAKLFYLWPLIITEAIIQIVLAIIWSKVEKSNIYPKSEKFKKDKDLIETGLMGTMMLFSISLIAVTTAIDDDYTINFTIMAAFCIAVLIIIFAIGFLIKVVRIKVAFLK